MLGGISASPDFSAGLIVGVSMTLYPGDQRMEYRVVPFTASITQKDGAGKAAAQLQALIAQHAEERWEYVRLEHVETNIAGTNGCFGLGASPSRTISVSMIVFRR